MHFGAAAKFPQAGIGHVMQCIGTLAQRLKPAEGIRIALILQAQIEEQLRGRQHHAAIDIVLLLDPRQVAAPHRTHAAVTGHGVHFVFFQLRFEADAV